MADLPADVGTGIVRVRLRQVGLVSSGTPATSALPVRGKVIFIPSTPLVKHVGDGLLFPMKPVVSYLDVNGDVSVELMATNDPQLAPIDWTYEVQFVLDSLEIDPFHISVPEGSDTELSDIVPIPGSGGTFYLGSGLTTEDAQDVFGAMVVAAGGTYNDIAGTVTFPPAAADWSTLTGKPAVIAAGATQALARTAIDASPTTHVHSGADITTGTVVAARLPVSSSTAQGIVELATTAEATTGTDTTRAVTAAGVKAVADTKAALSHTHAWTDITSKPTVFTPDPLAAQAINAQTGTSYTLVAGDAGKLVTLTNAAAITLTIPGSVFTAGQRIDCAVLGTGMVTCTGTGVNGTPSLVSRARYSAFTVFVLTPTTFLVVGDLA